MLRVITASARLIQRGNEKKQIEKNVMVGFFKKLFGGGEPRIATVKPFNAEVVVEPAQTLLEAALAQGVPFPHNCTVGTCASCKCRLTSGSVTAITDFGYTLSKQELDAGYILACQARLKSAVTVEVESPAADTPAPEHFQGRISRTEDLTHDIKSVSVTLDRPINFIAGQYANVTVDGVPARSYSFATAPDRGGRSEITFFIRKIPGGRFTEKLFSGQMQSAEVGIDGPHGTFYLRPGGGPDCLHSRRQRPRSSAQPATACPQN
jgi:p-cymene methyl-monooxygenase electron transfer component